jgi:NAD(P)-dependent dehydrogenase (short-subunit alcohol dehydrogenase family)
MQPQLKPLSQQTVVVTGASSGHGLATARRAARAGATVLLVARDEEALKEVRDGILAAGGKAEYVVADVGEEADVERVARVAIDRFGGFDSWVNNAGVGVYADALDIPTEDHQQVFRTNYFGTVYGSLAAVRHFRDKPGGGALINVGSVNSDMGSPVLAAYNASKHAVKGFTDSLRIEMIGANAPVSITLVKPSAIGTPFPQHGRNLTGARARLPQPLYAPEIVADAILHAMENPRRSITVGGAGKVQVLGATILPGLFDRIASRMKPTLLEREHPVGPVEGNLEATQGNNGQTEGRQHGRPFSLWTGATLNPRVAAGVALAGGAALAIALAGARPRRLRFAR